MGEDAVYYESLDEAWEGVATDVAFRYVEHHFNNEITAVLNLEYSISLIEAIWGEVPADIPTDNGVLYQIRKA